ncbi:MAG: hypothetical protein R6U78_09370 [Bacteroidales bacterium]
MKTGLLFFLILLSAMFFAPCGTCGQDAGYRPGLLFREDWKEILAAIPVSQEHVEHPDLVIHLFGPGRDSIKKSHHDRPADDPYYIWSGLCTGNWAVALSIKGHRMDLSEFSKIRWRSRQSGLRKLHILLKLADGTWLVSEQGDPASADWRIREFNLPDIRWYILDMELITELRLIQDPDLTSVESVGFTDLMRGGGSPACSRLDWIEVDGYLVPEKH